MDCGSTSLRIIAAYYGKRFSAQYLRELCHTARDGVSLLSVSEAAEAIGFRTQGVRITWEQFCDEMPMPCIVHWNQQHFAVVYKIRRRRNDYQIYVSDPACGKLKYKKDAFLKSWGVKAGFGGGNMGVILMLEPTPRFYKTNMEQSDRLSFRFLLRYLKPYRKFIIQLFVALFTGSVIGIIMPFLTQAMVDDGIGSNDLHFVVVILIAQVMLVFGQLANDLIRNWLMLHITTRVSIALISDFLQKLMRLPIAFFDSKMVGDILQRIDDHNRIQDFLTGTLISMIMGILMLVVYAIVMTGYSWQILVVFLIGSLLYSGWVILFVRRRRKLDYMRFQAAAADQNNVVQLLNGMQDIKLNNCERAKLWEWEKNQAKLYKIHIKSQSLNQAQQIGAICIDQTKNVLISFIAARAVINGNMTLGMMMAMQYIIGQLNAPVGQFIGFIRSLQDAKISMERLNEIHSRQDEEPAECLKCSDIPADADIELKNVIFQYGGPHSEKVLNRINLNIRHNEVTAIVGASGSGKTTLLKLLLGFYSPVKGTIMLGNMPLDHFSSRTWRAHCGVVMQDGYIFSDTIANNIAISDDRPDISKIEKAVEIANISDFIKNLPLGFSTKVGTDGQGLSSGQRQRILIARAAYKNAPFLIFDEATNALDAKNEAVIMNNLNRLFQNKTVIIVAHRLSTVKNADKIVVLDHGIIVEEGTHNELIVRKGYYFNLVSNQLELGT